MDGKGQVIDNIFIERFWRTLKYEEVYTKCYETVVECRAGIGGLSANTMKRCYIRAWEYMIPLSRLIISHQRVWHVKRNTP